MNRMSVERPELRRQKRPRESGTAPPASVRARRREVQRQAADFNMAAAAERQGQVVPVWTEFKFEIALVVAQQKQLDDLMNTAV